MDEVVIGRIVDPSLASGLFYVQCKPIGFASPCGKDYKGKHFDRKSKKKYKNRKKSALKSAILTYCCRHEDTCYVSFCSTKLWPKPIGSESETAVSAEKSFLR